MPNNDFEGSDKFEYTVRDDDGDTSTATVRITKERLNYSPISVDNKYKTLDSIMLTIPG